MPARYFSKKSFSENSVVGPACQKTHVHTSTYTHTHKHETKTQTPVGFKVGEEQLVNKNLHLCFLGL